MFNPVKAQIAFGRFISFGVDTRHIERAIRSAVAATDAFIFVNDKRFNSVGDHCFFLNLHTNRTNNNFVAALNSEFLSKLFGHFDKRFFDKFVEPSNVASYRAATPMLAST